MSLFRSLNSFRAKLIIGLVIPVIIIFGFDFYIFTQGSQLQTLLKITPFTQDEAIILEKGIQNFSQVSFFFLSLVIIFNLGIAIILVVILTFSMRMILNGIKKIEGGDLSFRIPLQSQDEFGTIAEFLNTATSRVEMTQTSIEQKVLERTTQLAYHNRLLIAIRRLDEAALSTIEIEPLAHALVDAASNELQASLSGIAIVEEQSNNLRRIAISTYYPQGLEEILKIVPIPYSKQTVSLKQTDNLLVKAILEKRVQTTTRLYDIQKGLFTQDFSDYLQKMLGEKLKFKQLYIYPLITKEKILGVIQFALPKTKDELSQTEFAMMDGFTKVAVKVLENALLYRELKKDKIDLSAERNKFAVALSGITDGVIAVDLERKITIFNTAAERLTGYSKREVLGKRLDQVIRIFDKEQEVTPFTYCPIRTDGIEGIVLSKANLKMVGKREAFVNLISGQIAEGVQNNLGCILTLHDVSEEQELERMKLDFVSMAAHELRTPLTTIKGYLYIYLRDYKASLNEKQTTMLQRVSISTQKLATLVENLLNISRIERGNLSINLQPLDWESVVETAIREIIEQAKDKKIELTMGKPSQIIPKVVADPTRINEVLSNLLSNAVTYTNPGGKIKVWVERKGGEVITNVSDTGQGIPAESLPHLFTKFFRVSGTLEQGSKGTGLGLYIAKSIVSMHHGKIWVESKLGEGSTFSFSLPVYMEETLPQ